MENFNTEDIVHVDSYTRANGTFVEDYYRRKPGKGIRSIIESDDTNFFQRIKELFPNIDKLNNSEILKDIFSLKMPDMPQIIRENSTKDNYTVYMPEDTSGLFQNNTENYLKRNEMGFIDKAIPSLFKVAEVVKNATVKAGEIVADAARRAGEAAVNTTQNVNSVLSAAPKELILDTVGTAESVLDGASETVLQGSVVINDIVDETIEITKSGILDTLKDALSKIDTDKVTIILSKAVKEFTDIVEKYPELQKAYEKLNSVRINATVYRGLERQNLHTEAMNARNIALISAKDFGHEMQKMMATKFNTIQNIKNAKANYKISTADIGMEVSQNSYSANTHAPKIYREPSLMDIQTPVNAYWSNPYYTDITPLQNNIKVGESNNINYETFFKTYKKNIEYNKFLPEVQKYLGKIGYRNYPVASEYYKIALNNGNNIGTNNYKCKLYELSNEQLINFINQKYNVPEGTNVIIPAENAEIRTEILASSFFWDAIEQNINKIERIPNSLNNFTVEFKNSSNPIDKDLFATLHKAYIYSPYYDLQGNIHLIIVDYYDFAVLNGKGIITLINNNAYIQQELGMLTNYVIIIPMVISPLDKWNI